LIDSVNKQLIVKISDINFQYRFEYEFWSEPEWIKDNGTGYLKVVNATVLLNLLPSNKDGVI